MIAVLVLAVVVAVGIAGYLASCAAFPFIDCKRCEGTGEIPRWHRLSTQLCPHCDGEGAITRSGAYFLNAVRTRS